MPGEGDGTRPVFGKRGRPVGTDVARAAAPPVKRSATVSLVLVAGAGASALVLGHLDPARRVEDVLVYPDAAACAADGLRSRESCDEAYATARAAYPGRAPRYASQWSCERHHGRGRCVAGETVTEDARGTVVPVMAGVLLGRTAAQGVPAQPVFDHAPDEGGGAGGAGHAGYCSATGGRIATAGGRSGAARVAASSVHGPSFGGFGVTGRAVSLSAHGG